MVFLIHCGERAETSRPSSFILVDSFLPSSIAQTVIVWSQTQSRFFLVSHDQFWAVLVIEATPFTITMDGRWLSWSIWHVRSLKSPSRLAHQSLVQLWHFFDRKFIWDYVSSPILEFYGPEYPPIFIFLRKVEAFCWTGPCLFAAWASWKPLVNRAILKAHLRVSSRATHEEWFWFHRHRTRRLPCCTV